MALASRPDWIPEKQKRRASDFIRQRPAGNFHHGIRLASSKGFPLNLFISINFSLTGCPAEETDLAFMQIRAHFGKWITRPRKAARGYEAPPTFVWVIENCDGCLNGHWLVHVPAARQKDFREKLDKWLRAAAGDVNSNKALHIVAAKTPTAVGKYMLKGMYPTVARDFGIDPSYQGWVTGRRVGHSKNVGPVQLAQMRSQGKHPPAKRWIHGKYSNNY